MQMVNVVSLYFYVLMGFLFLEVAFKDVVCSLPGRLE